MTTINNGIEQAFAGPLARIEKDATTSRRYLRQLADVLGTNRETWPDECRLLSDGVRARLLATQQRIDELSEAIVMVVALGTSPA